MKIATVYYVACLQYSIQRKTEYFTLFHYIETLTTVRLIKPIMFLTAMCSLQKKVIPFRTN